jgi:hypothetical protein
MCVSLFNNNNNNEKNKTKFDETDVDGSGDLDPSELVPIILEISKMHHGDVSPDRAVEFCKVFDDDGNGKKKEKKKERYNHF